MKDSVTVYLGVVTDSTLVQVIEPIRRVESKTHLYFTLRDTEKQNKYRMELLETSIDIKLNIFLENKLVVSRVLKEERTGKRFIKALLKVLEVFEVSSNDWLLTNLHLLSLGGSTTFGLDTGTSDFDFRAVCVPPIDYYMGLKHFNEYKKSGGKNLQGENTKNTADDVDLTAWHISKFVADAQKSKVENILMLFTDREDFLMVSPIGELLLENRHLFLSKNIKNSFGGFATKQLKLLNKSFDGETYNSKLAYYCVLYLQIAIEVAETHTLNPKRHNKEELLKIKTGEYTFSKVLELIDDLDRQMVESLEVSTLREAVDYNAINALLIKANKMALEKELLEL